MLAVGRAGRRLAHPNPDAHGARPMRAVLVTSIRRHPSHPRESVSHLNAWTQKEAK